MELTAYIWEKLEPALQEIVESVRRDNPSVGTRIEHYSTDVFPLRGSAVFLSARRAVDENEDLVIQVACRHEAGALECYSDITDGMASFLVHGPRIVIETGRNEARSHQATQQWIDATASFIAENKELVIRKLSPPPQ